MTTPRSLRLLAATGAAAAALSLLSLAAPEARGKGPGAAPLAAPKLGVVVAVDGLSWPRLHGYRSRFTGGLSRLLAEGRLERACRYRHINTETGPGHAALGTGAPPRVTGIVANRWFEARGDGSLRQVYCTDVVREDPQNGDELLHPGPDNLRVPTMADRFVERYPEARVVSISGKDRGSIFLAGKTRSHSVWWWDKQSGRFVTSESYDPAAPKSAPIAAVVSRWNKRDGAGYLPARLGLLWKRLASVLAPAPPGEAAPVPAADLQTYQVPANGLGFDHDVSRHKDGYFGGLYASPFVDEVVADVALAVLRSADVELGHRETPDLLLLSFSAQDTVSHNYGPESEENLDALLKLDAQLGRLFEVFDRDYPAGKVVLALSADHGFLPIPESEERRDRSFSGGRLVYGSYPGTSYLARLNRALAEDLCLPAGSRPLHGSEGWNVKYDLPGLPALRTVEGPCGPAGRPVTSADLDRVLPGAVRRLFSEEVSDVLLVSERQTWNDNLPYVEFARNDFDAERSGEAILIPRPNVLMHWDPGRGTGHGSQYDPETHVPLVFWGDGITAVSSDSPTTPYDLAPTVGRLFGISVPDATGRPLAVGR
ncbi:MAG: hypothetical protein EDX89_09080 [Acidobacteria bacterium]|nr:MAG: hypothetical protein EDX89_09080 [Acidobacteriota bacterium]MCE7958810.1 hypothetical protein [Acidobacteria bacterium ACB2]